MKAIFLKDWPILILLFLSLFIIWPLLLPGYFSHHDDLQIMRIFEMRKCIFDLQIPCRWVPDMGYGNGFPLFNYYGVFPYYLGAILSFVFGYIGSAKILFFLPLTFGGVFMYLLAKELTNKFGGFFAGILYMFAPYKALDAYVRGDVTESFSITLAPLLFYFSLKLIQEKSKKYFLLNTLALAAFLTTHNIMTLFFIPVWFIYIFLLLFFGKKNKSLILIFGSLVLGIGLSAFFILPAFVEKSLVNTDSLRIMDLNFRAHFVTVEQIFISRFWGYGASTPGINDTISFQIGWPHWWLVGLGIILIPISLIKLFNKFLYLFNKNQFILIIFLFVVFIGSIFMMHNKSAFVWEKIDLLQYTQFPWRFLALTIFSSSLLGGYLILIFKNKKWQLASSILLSSLTILLNFSFFKPETFYPNLTDQEKLSGKLFEDQQKAAINDYLPKTAYEPREKAPILPLVISGKAEVSNFLNYSNKFKFNVNVFDKANIEVPVFEFPNWQTFVNQKLYPHSHQNLLGRIRLDLVPGNYQVVGQFKDTSIRQTSNMLSLISLITLLIITRYGKNKLFNS
ncbi:hypothetical protein HY025_00100 [Candidatus Daviesbacteria bacterium]|nr:hypothetical protein [Candidatus Daviesbacteria bacterium]